MLPEWPRVQPRSLLYRGILPISCSNDIIIPQQVQSGTSLLLYTTKMTEAKPAHVNADVKNLNRKRKYTMISYGCLVVLFLFVAIKLIIYYIHKKRAPTITQIDTELLSLLNRRSERNE
jgi:hypothetical protein